MNTGKIAALAGLTVAASSSASFIGFVVTSQAASNSGQSLTVYTVWARFNGPTDTVLNAFNLAGVAGSSMTGFWHKDNAYYNSGILSQEFGTWNPSQTGSVPNNRPFDSYLTIGGLATPTNTTNSDPSWTSGGNADGRSWNRADLPTNGTIGWFNSNPPNNQGRVGLTGNTTTDVRIGQFVLSANDSAARTYSLTIGYNDGVPGSAAQFPTSTFTLGCGATWYRDLDGDGVGLAADGTTFSCTQPSGYAATNGDNCPGIPNPNQEDVNGNGLGDACELAYGDLNLDGVVNASDVPLFFNSWGSNGANGGDLNRDGIVNAADFSILLANWGTAP